MSKQLTSKERMIAALSGEKTDYTPCSFMIFYNLFEQCSSQKDFIDRQLGLGLDTFANVGKLHMSFHPDVSVRSWEKKEHGADVIVREIETPAGVLSQEVVEKSGWPEGENLPLFDDRIVPRAQKVLVDPEQDLDKVRYLFGSFEDSSIKNLKDQAASIQNIADDHGLLTIAGELGDGFENAQIIGVGDLLAWLSGFETTMFAIMDYPEIIKEYVTIISNWNLDQIAIYLDVTNADLIVRRGWYENTEFWTPEAFEYIIAPTIKKEAEIVHQAGKKYGYIITSSYLPILDTILDCDIDVLIGVDPIEGKGTHLDEVKNKVSQRNKALWGGVSGAVTVETGTEEQTKEAVIHALQLLGSNGGFILSPVDNVRENTEKAWRNTRVFIDTWKQNRTRFLS
jgi:uroporphyrinogen-III decarboxylase